MAWDDACESLETLGHDDQVNGNQAAVPLHVPSASSNHQLSILMPILHGPFLPLLPLQLPHRI